MRDHGLLARLRPHVFRHAASNTPGRYGGTVDVADRRDDRSAPVREQATEMASAAVMPGDSQGPTGLYADLPARAERFRVAMVVPQAPTATWLLEFVRAAAGLPWLDVQIVVSPDVRVGNAAVPNAGVRAFLATASPRQRVAGAAEALAQSDAALDASVIVAAGRLHEALHTLQPDLVLMAGVSADRPDKRMPWRVWALGDGLLDPVWSGMSLLDPILDGDSATLVGLELDLPGPAAPIALATSWAATYQLFRRQRQQAFRKLPVLLLRAVRRLAAGDPVLEHARAATLRLVAKPGQQRPLAGARAAAIGLLARVRWQIRRRLDESWSLLLRENEQRLDPTNPDFAGLSVLQAGAGRYWADPCAVDQGERRLLFVEEYDEQRAIGVIACLELLADGSARRLGIALDEPFHLSYPQVFRWQGAWYMTVESAAARRMSLYRATDFPMRWERASDLLTGCHCVDGTLHHHRGHWYLFANIAEGGGSSCDDLFLFVADAIEGPYRAHPANPIVTDVRRARPAGRLFERDGRLVRPGQDCGPEYGAAIAFNEVLELDPVRYAERPLGRLAPLASARMTGCHTYSASASTEVLDAYGRLPQRWRRLKVIDAGIDAETPSGCAPRLSVVLRAGNAPAAAIETVACMLRQSCLDLELIVVAGPEAMRALDPVARNAPVPVLLRAASASPEQDVHDALASARGRYITVSDAGDRWPSALAASCIEALERDPGLGAVHAGGTVVVRASLVHVAGLDLAGAALPELRQLAAVSRIAFMEPEDSDGREALADETPVGPEPADAGLAAAASVPPTQPRPVPALPKTVGVGTHYLRYSTANLLVLAAGFISFPILTRLLDNAQYGILGYYEAWVGLAVAFAKLGTQHSLVRFYPFQGGPERMQHFNTNLVAMPVAISLALWLLVALTLGGYGTVSGSGFSPVFWCAFASIPLLVLGSVVEMLFRASERSLALSVMRIAKRWLELALVLGAVIALQQTALAVYWGRLAAAALILVYCMHWARRHLNVSRKSLDLDAMFDSWRYGMPLVVNEVAFIVLISVDRVMLKHMTGDFEAVGIYTIGYSLAMQINILMQATLYEAFMPVANRVYAAEGDAGVRALKGRVMVPITYAAIAVAAMILAVGNDAIHVLSGANKLASGPVFVVVGMTFALYPLIDIGGYGLLLRKRSMLVLGTTVAAALANILLNMLLIPSHGVMGAVVATTFSYTMMGVVRYRLCPPALRCLPPLRPVLLACACAGLFLLAIGASHMLGVLQPWSRLLVAGVLFLLLFALPLWLLDPGLRQLVRHRRDLVAA
ncbi:MAG: hypothetical protein EOP93_06575 [Lysobacteraceae bacterium]|nr:MAG: hypothetical protein EOP93_06575 [Xanthomonadaceae bacterium]